MLTVTPRIAPLRWLPFFSMCTNPTELLSALFLAECFLVMLQNSWTWSLVPSLYAFSVSVDLCRIQTFLSDFHVSCVWFR